MKIKTIPVGYLAENAYILSKNGKCLIIDPGDEGEKIDSYLDGKLVAVLITHSHFDHVGAVEYFKKKYGVKVYYKNDFKEGENEIDDFKFDVYYFPGHLDDLVGYYFKEEKWMFFGDFVFSGSIGRTDLAGGNNIDMANSLKKLLKFDKDVTIYPGHGDITTLKDEEKTLEYFIQELQNS